MLQVQRTDELVVLNQNRFARIFLSHNDSAYKSKPDERLTDISPGAEVVENVLIDKSEQGLIVSPAPDKNGDYMKVDLLFSLSEVEPLDIIPVPSKGRQSHNRRSPYTEEEKKLFELDPKVLEKYPALFKAAQLFNESLKLTTFSCKK